MATRSQTLPARETSKSKVEVIYKTRPLHWMVKTGGYGTTLFLGVVYFCTVIGDWTTIGISDSNVILVFKAIGS